MFDIDLDKYLFLPAGLTAFLICMAAIISKKLHRSRWILAAIVALDLVFVARLPWSFQHTSNFGWDFRHWWTAGTYIWAGLNPYDVAELRPPNQYIRSILYPPTVLPLFAIFALAPRRWSSLIWNIVNLVFCLCIGVMGRRALIAQDPEPHTMIDAPAAALLATPLILSKGTFIGLDGGVLSILATMSVLVALTTQFSGSKRRVCAAGLAVATIKFTTLIPFLLLFLRKSDRRTLLLCGAFVTALTFSTGNPANLPTRLSTLSAAIRVSREPGRVNDYSPLNPRSGRMVGIDVALARAGMTDRRAIDWLTRITLLAIGLSIAYAVLRHPEIPRGAICSLISLYSTLFVYHRIHELTILILPLLYCASRFVAITGVARWCYAWVVLAVVAAINKPERLETITGLSPSWILLKRLDAVFSVHFILSALVALAFAAIWESRAGTYCRPDRRTESE